MAKGRNWLALLTALLITACGGGGGGGSSTTPPTSGREWQVSTLAGPAQGPGMFNASGAAASFYYPAGVASDGAFLYLADSGNHTVRKINPGTSEVATLAGSAGVGGSSDSSDGTGATARLRTPGGIVSLGAFLYVVDSGNHTIRKIHPATGATTTLAGLAGVSGSSDSSDATGATARFNAPRGMTTDDTFLYVVDSGNHTVRRISPVTGATTTLAGLAGVSGSSDSSDGTGATARFNAPSDIATDATYLYVSDERNHTVRKLLIATGNTITLAGLAGVSGSSNSSDGTGATARFDRPRCLTVVNNLLVVGDANQLLRRVLLATGETTALAGAAGQGGYVDSSDGTGATARFLNPTAMVFELGQLYVSEENHVLRKVLAATGDTSTLAGQARLAGASDAGTGSASRFATPNSIANDGVFAYVADTANCTIRKVVLATGATTTLAGLAGTPGTADSSDASGATARFVAPAGIALGNGRLLVGDAGTIRTVDPLTGDTSTLAGAPGTTGSADSSDGTGATARFHTPRGLTVIGNFLFVADSGNHTLRKVLISSGATTTVAGLADTSGSTDGIGALARFSVPTGLTSDGISLFVSDQGSHLLRRVTIASGLTVTLAGAAGVAGSADSSTAGGSTARFNTPAGLATDGTYLYLADTGNHSIRRILASSGDTVTIAGSAAVYGSRDGIGTAAAFFAPSGLARVGTSLLVGDSVSANLRLLTFQ